MSCFPCGSAIICRGTQPPGKRGQLGCTRCTREPSSIYSCPHVQHAQETGDLPPLSPLVSKPPSSTEVDHLFPKKRQRSAIPLSYTITCTIRLSLEKGEPWLQSPAPNREAIDPGSCTSKRCTRHRAGRSELERHTSQTPKDASLPSYTHTERLQHLLIGPTDNADGNDPHPLEARPKRPVLRSRERLNLQLEHAPETAGDNVSRDLVPGCQPRRKHAR